MGERIGRIERIDTDFSFGANVQIRANQKKSVSIRSIRPIRSPIVSQSYHTIPKSEIHIPKSKHIYFKFINKIIIILERYYNNL
jgi:hypothetical protein